MNNRIINAILVLQRPVLSQATKIYYLYILYIQGVFKSTKKILVLLSPPPLYIFGPKIENENSKMVLGGELRAPRFFI